MSETNLGPSPRACKARGRAAVAGAAIETLEARRLLSVATLVKDINTTSAPSTPAGFVSIGSTMYFTANDGVHGTELWKSDGTTAGTSMVSDLTPGSGSTSYGGLVALGDKLVYDSPSNQLWATDGTAAGTVPIGPANQYIYAIGSLGGRLYYNGSGPDGDELWTSDGTAAGTYEVKDIYAGGASSFPTYFTPMGGYLYFTATDAAHGTELWRTDGTSQGTTLVADVIPGPNSSSILHLAAGQGVLYFDSNSQIWKTDGTAAGTVAVTNLPGSNLFNDLAVAGSTLYFQDTVGATTSVYASDGTAAGTVEIATLPTNGSMTAPATQVNGKVVFWTQNTLWQTDGTAAGTTAIATTGQPGSIYQLAAADGAIFYMGYDSASRINPTLWRTDGTAAGTSEVEALTGLALQNTSASFMGVMTGTVYYSDGEPRTVAPGATQSTLLKEINPFQPYGSNPQFPGVAGGKAYFLANDGQHTPGEELWVTDGTADGTQFLHDFGTGFGSPYPSAYAHTDLNGSYLFAAAGHLWRSDATPDTTYQITAYTGSGVTAMVAGDDFAYVLASGGSQALLWRTDGTNAGTYALDVPSLQSVNTVKSTDLSRFVTLGDKLIFVGLDATHGYELWSSDGTSAGTAMVADLSAGGTSSGPLNLTRFNGAVYFSASNGSVQQVYKTDGTAAGTVPIDAINTALAAAGLGTNPGFTSFTPVGSKLFFVVTTSAYGPELWEYDAATDHAQLVKDIVPGNVSYPYPMELTALGNHLYFVDADSDQNFQLWQTDGTAAGTVKVTDRPWAPSQFLPQLQNLTAAGDAVFFTNGSQLYEAQETAIGVQIVPVSASNPFGKPLATTDAQTLLALGDNLLFTASDGTLGPEPYIVSGAPQLAANAGGPYHVAEGQSVTLSAAASTAVGSPIVSYEWDLSGATGGSFHADATGPMLTLSNLDGPATKYVALRVTDAAGDVSYTQAVVYVTNTPPAVAISGPAVTLPEGSTYTINLSAGNDPGQDTISSWRIDWGDGTVQTIAGNPSTATHAYGHGTRHYTISALATDEDGSYSTNSLAIGFTDPSFGTNGVSTAAGLFAGQRVVQLPDGHLLTAGAVNGSVTLARFNADGSLDTSFGGGGSGSVTISIPGAVSVGALQVAPDGKIVLGTSPGWVVARFNADGSLDASFGAGGIASPPAAGALHDLKVMADGSIVAAGQVDDGSAGALNFAAVKLTSDGSLDTSFGNAGMAHVDFGYGNDTACSAAVLPDGRILLGGTALRPYNLLANNNLVALARLTPDGSLDPTFGTGGLASTALTTVGAMTATSMAVDPVAQKIYVGGGGVEGNGQDSTMILRYNLANGSLDTSYGQGGKWSANGYEFGDIASIAVDPEGDVTYADIWSFNNSVRIGRVLPGGVSDAVWSGGSVLPPVRTPPFDATAKTLGNLVLTPDGRVLAVVQSQLGTGLAEMGTEVPQVGIDITDVPPTNPDIGPDRTADEGSPVAMSATYIDPGFADTFTYLWHVTASNGQVIADGNAQNFTFTPTDNGVYTVQFTVTDDMGYSSSAAATITVDNVAPSVSLGTDRSTNEGTAQTFTATVVDPSTVDTQSLQYHWTATLNGAVVAQSTATTFSFTPPDDGLYTIGLSVTDKDGGVGSGSFLLTVLNVPPTITVTGASSVPPGATYYLSATATDPGTDRITRWTIDWGDGTAPTVLSARPINVTHVFNGTGRFAVVVSATDEDGTWSAPAKFVGVSNAPTLGADGTLTITGTASGDQVNVVVNGATTYVYENSAATTFTTSAVQRVVVNLLDGDDLLSAGNLLVPVTYDGGAGNDRLDVDVVGSTNHTMSLAPGKLSGLLSGTGAVDVFSNVEAVSISGNSYNDSLSVDPAAAVAVTFDAGVGTDSLTLVPATGASANADTSVTLVNGVATVGACQVTYTQLENLTVQTGGGNDTMTFDWSKGTPFPTSSVYVYGGGGANTLVESGTTSAADAFTLSANTVTLGAYGVVVRAYQFQTARFPGGSGGSDTVTVSGGAWQLDADTPIGTTPSESITVQSGAAVTLLGDQRLAGLTISGGSVALSPSFASTLTLSGPLSISGGGTLDLGVGSLLVPTSANIAAYIKQAAGSVRTGGVHAWDGAGGLTSSAVKADAANNNAGALALGYFDSRDNATTNLSVPAGDTLVKVTVYGDATGDGVNDTADFTVWRNNFFTGNRWSQGDFNYDGVIDTADFTIWRNNFFKHASAAASPDAVATGSVAAAPITDAAPQTAVPDATARSAPVSAPVRSAAHAQPVAPSPDASSRPPRPPFSVTPIGDLGGISFSPAVLGPSRHIALEFERRRSRSVL